MGDVVDSIKNFALENNEDNVIVVLHEKLCTTRLMQAAGSMNYLKSKVLGHSVIYTNVTERFNLSMF